MQVSAESRWFWPDAAPAGLQSWFCKKGAAHTFPAGGGGPEPREDKYLVEPGQIELGIKNRGGKEGVEIKGLVEVGAELREGVFVSRIEVWTKWTSTVLKLPAGKIITTSKWRWLRKYDTAAGSVREIALKADEKPRDKKARLPDRGCNVELTKVVMGKKTWWTFGFESFGSVQTVQKDLRTVARFLAAKNPPGFTKGLAMSYPAWLARRA